MHLPAFCLQVSVSKDCFSQCYKGLEKVAGKLSLLIEWQVPTGFSGVWGWSGQREETATSSISKEWDAVMTHPAPFLWTYPLPMVEYYPYSSREFHILVDVGLGWWHKRAATVWCDSSVLHHDEGNRHICVTSSWMHDPLLCLPGIVQWGTETEAWETSCGPQLSPQPSLISQTDGVLNLKISGCTERIY